MIKDIKIKNEKEMLEELKEERKKRDFEKYGGDGYLVAGEKDYTYKGVKYTIKILRYFTLKPNEFKPVGYMRTIDMHSVVEYPEETKEFVKCVKSISGDYYEFLFHDTLHTHNEKQTIEEQIDECHKLAKQDINGIPKFIEEAQVEIDKLKEIMVKLRAVAEIPT